jgi:hypothetical protein
VSTKLRQLQALAIGKVLLQLMDARTFVRNHDGIKTGYTKDVQLINVRRCRNRHVRNDAARDFDRGESDRRPAEWDGEDWRIFARVGGTKPPGNVR